MRLVDRALPAVEHLVGDGALDVLRPPVEAAGGVLHAAKPVQVQYRPGSDVVVRYAAEIAWGDGAVESDTLVAASTTRGPLPDTVTVTADTPDGPLEVGVWRWPFDPMVTGLGSAVTPRSVATLLGLDPYDIRLDVVAYRPTERAVVRVTTGDGAVSSYLKVVAPKASSALAARHAVLIDAGVPAPRVVEADHEAGILVLEPLIGPTLRELIKSKTGEWVAADEFDRLADGFAGARLDAPPIASRVSDGVLHAQMLRKVAPRLRGRLDELIDWLQESAVPAADTTVHGDLHEAQLVVDGGRIVGVLDIDDAGPGAPIDDRANVIARLVFRSTLDQRVRTELDHYAETLRTASLDRFGGPQLDVHIAAALVGLATGPFRMQGPTWREDVASLTERAANMRKLSS